MASRPREFDPNRAYHIFNRAVIEKQQIFNFDRDYQRFLNTLEYYLLSERKLRFSDYLELPPHLKLHPNKLHPKGEGKRARLLAYAVMPNHFHLLMRPTKENPTALSQVISDVTNSYTRYFNVKYKRSGVLFQGVFKDKEIPDNESILQVSRYIHLNPLVSKKANPNETLRSPQNWAYSSYFEWVGLKNPHLVDKTEVERFTSLVGGPQGYKKFTEAKIDQDSALNIGPFVIE